MEGAESSLAKLKFSTMKNMLDLLECPICAEVLYPPIYQVYNYSSNHFLVTLETINSEKYKNDHLVSIALMGEHDEAKKFRCKLEIGDDEHKLSWKGEPLSIRLGKKELNETLVGLIIPNRFFSRFSKYSGPFYQHFRVKGYILEKKPSGAYKSYFYFLPFVQRLYFDRPLSIYPYQRLP